MTKITKIFLFTVLAFFAFNIVSVSAGEVTDSVTIRVCADNEKIEGSSCVPVATNPVVTPCANGATNPPTCNIYTPVSTEYTITTSSSSGGSVTPLGSIKVKEGDTFEIVYSPNTGFGVSSVLVDGSPQSYFTYKYKFINVKANHTFDVNFAKNKDVPTIPTDSIGVSLSIVGDSTITLPDDSVKLKWIVSGSVDICIASGDWSGIKSKTTIFSHTEVLNNLTAGSYVYNIRCKRGTEEVSDSVSLIVKPAPVYIDPNSKAMSGTITAGDCFLKLGERSCSIPFSWEVFNPEVVGGSAVTIPVNNKIGDGDKGSSSFTFLFGNTTLYLYNNGKELSQTTVEVKTNPAVCSWNSKDRICEFVPPSEVDTSNSGENLINPINLAPEKIDGGWSEWTPTRSSVCGDSGSQTRACNNPTPQNGGVWCPSDMDGTATSKNYTNINCPSVNLEVKSGGSTIPANRSVKYNSFVTVVWTSNNTRSCSCTYSDEKSSGNSCSSGVNNSYKVPVALKRNTTFKVSCLGDYGMPASDSATVLVDKISTGYIEQ